MNLTNETIQQHIFGDILKRSVVVELRYFGEVIPRRASTPRSAVLAARLPRFCLASRFRRVVSFLACRRVSCSVGASCPSDPIPPPSPPGPDRRHRHRLELGPRDGVPPRGRRAPARAGRQPGGPAPCARPGPHRQDPARGARARLRGAAGLPRDRARVGCAPHRGRGHLGAPRRDERPALHQARQTRARHHDPHPVRAGGGALRLPRGGGRAAGRPRHLLRPGRRQPAGRPLPQPAPGRGGERPARGRCACRTRS